MKSWGKYVLLGVLALCAAATWFYLEVLRPWHLFAEAAELPSKSLSDTEWRELSHDCIRWRNHHDAFLSLIKVGDESSIPYLIRALKRLEGDQSCVKAHCIDALEAASGQSFGDDVTAWEAWYATQ